jgi:hypothetical protein
LLVEQKGGIGAPDSGGLDIRQAPDGSVSVPGLKLIPVHCIEDVMEVFARGSANRATATTNLNEHSSRSHSILLIDVTTTARGCAPVRSKLYLVDLAGSERVAKSGATGATMKEAQHINKSLSALGDVMEALDQKSKHIPYRNSKLTYLLQDSLGGNSRTMMIVTACPTELTIEETLFTLQFAVRVRNISLGSAKRQVSTKNLEEALRVLKAEMKETKKRRMQLEETVQEVKRENKRLTDKAATITENKQRATEDARSKVDGQIQQLMRTNDEMKSRITEEKEAKQQAVQELDLVQKTLKKTQDQMKEINKDKDKILYQLKQKDKDYEALKLLHHQQMQKMEKQIADKVVALSQAEAFSSSSILRKKSVAASISTITPSFGALSSSSIDTVESNIGDQNNALNNSTTSFSTSTHRSPEKSLEGSLLRPPSRITSTTSSRLSSSGTTTTSERALGLKPPARVGIPRPSTGSPPKARRRNQRASRSSTYSPCGSAGSRDPTATVVAKCCHARSACRRSKRGLWCRSCPL